jgi:HlyD family type I secretion membrane fusion protein
MMADVERSEAQPAAVVSERYDMLAQRPFPIGSMIAGILVILSFLGSLTIWSTLAPIESAVVSPGVVSVASYRKTIQHLEGGIVDDILIDEGDEVQAGQLLIKLQDVQLITQVRQLHVQFAEARAIEARLRAERDNIQQLTMPDDLLSGGVIDPEVERAFRSQQKILFARRQQFVDQRSVLEQKIAQAQALIIGLKGQEVSTAKRLELARQELDDIQPLAKKSLVPMPRLRELESKIAELEGLLSEHRGDMAREEKEILEAELQISEQRTSAIAEISEQLRAERARAYDLSQQIVAAEDVLRRTKIRSPIEGIIVNLQIHTQEGVVAAGQPLMDIVPINDELVIEAFVNPEDIDEVRTGLPAHIHLTAQNRRQREVVEGIVADVSADRLADDETGSPYYRARIELNPESRDALGDNLLAGMGADVMIRTGARTPLDYLLQPITRSLQLGLREN